MDAEKQYFHSPISYVVNNDGGYSSSYQALLLNIPLLLPAIISSIYSLHSLAGMLPHLLKTTAPKISRIRA
jgi:hypothetical protein